MAPGNRCCICTWDTSLTNTPALLNAWEIKASNAWFRGAGRNLLLSAIKGQSSPEARPCGAREPGVSSLVGSPRDLVGTPVTELFHRTALQRSYQFWALLWTLASSGLAIREKRETRDWLQCENMRSSILFLQLAVSRKHCLSQQTKGHRSREREGGGEWVQIIWDIVFLNLCNWFNDDLLVLTFL